VALCAIALAYGCAGALVWAQDTLPTNPLVRPETTASTICRPGWAAQQRPGTSYTNAIKRAQLQAAGVPWSQARAYELDHRIPITLGGAPRDPRNLWLQAWGRTPPAGWTGETDAHGKDVLEVRLRRLVCAGALPLAAAQACIYTDWRACARAHPQPPTKGEHP
jgi:hypothetical protein